jgi:hypothetical protein
VLEYTGNIPLVLTQGFWQLSAPVLLAEHVPDCSKFGCNGIFSEGLWGGRIPFPNVACGATLHARRTAADEGVAPDARGPLAAPTTIEALAMMMELHRNTRRISCIEYNVNRGVLDYSARETIEYVGLGAYVFD